MEPKRRFIVVGHHAVTDSNFSMKDIGGTGGRLDILIRCINSAFMLSHGIRTDTELFLILKGPPSPPKCIRLDGKQLRSLNPDERSIAGLIRKAQETEVFLNERETTRGVSVSPRGLGDILKHVREDTGGSAKIVYLIESQDPVRNVISPGEEYVFVLGDNYDLEPDELSLMEPYYPLQATLGPKSLHSDHCIVIMHNILDTL